MTQHVETRASSPVPGGADGGTSAGGTGWPAVVVTDPAGVVVHWSASAAETYGWTAAEAVGRAARDLVVPPAEIQAAAEIGARLAAGDAWEGMFRVRHRDGSAFAAHVLDVPVVNAEGALVAIVGLSYPVGESRFPLLAAERALRTSAGRATERLRRLQQVTAELSRAMTTEEVAHTVLTRGMELEGAGSGALWLLDEAAGVLRLQGMGGSAPGLSSKFAALPLDAVLPGSHVVRTATPIYLRSRAERDERWPALVGTPSAMEAQAIVPLVVDGRCIGCLSFGFPEEREIGEGERDFLAALTNVCAQVLDRARLYDAERAASNRVAFLAEASRVLNGSLDYKVTLERVVAMLLEAFAAQVIIDLVGPDGAVERVAVGHVDPSKRAALTAIPATGVRPGTNGWEVLRTGTPRLIAEVSESYVRKVTTDEEYEILSALSLGPTMIVPLTARGRVTGLLYVGRPQGDPAFGPEDLALATDLGARAGSAVENARLFAQRTSVAATLQRSLLPPRLPDVPGVELAARYRPAYAGLEVGGDFYDCYAVGDGWAFMIGDVVGTGPAAAAVTAVVRNTARAVAPFVDGPAEVAHCVREALVAGGDDEVFCTMLYGSIERLPEGGVRLGVVGAGHPHPYVVRAGGAVERIVTEGSLLGCLEPVGIEVVEVLLRPGDSLVGVTDGVLEARPAPTWEEPSGGTDFFDEARLRAVLEGAAGSTADEIAGAVEAAVLEFTGGRTPDDVAVLVLRAL